MRLREVTIDEISSLLPLYPKSMPTKQVVLSFGGETTNGAIGNKVRRNLVLGMATGKVTETKVGRLSRWSRPLNTSTTKPAEIIQNKASPDISYEEVLSHIPLFPNRITTLEVVRLCGGDSTISPFSHKIRRRLMKGVDKRQVFTSFELGQSFWWRRELEMKEGADKVIEGPKLPLNTPPTPTPAPVQPLPVKKAPPKDTTDIRKDMVDVLLNHIHKGKLSESELLDWARVILSTPEIQFTDPQLRHILKLIWRVDWQS